VNESWTGEFHSACNHTACRQCIRKWTTRSLQGCAENGELRVPCFEPGCRRVLPQRLVLAFSHSANVLAEALDAQEKRLLHGAEPCERCGCLGFLVANEPCGHAVCGDCWTEWSVTELPRCRAEGRLNLSCCHPDCHEVADRGMWRRMSQWSPLARACLDFFKEVDVALAEMQVAGAVREARLAEAGPVCPVCCGRRVALLSAQADCAEQDHAACLDCWTRWAEDQLDRCIEQRAPSVRCMFPRCQQLAAVKLWPLVCARSIPAAELEQMFVRRRRLQANPFFPAELQVECPRPGCVGLGYLGHETVMCFLCEYQWVPDEGAGKAPETDVELVMGVAVKKCPKCGEYIEKNGGCNHMTCLCKHEFWWSTLQPFCR